MDRRSFLKKVVGGAAAVGVMSLIRDTRAFGQTKVIRIKASTIGPGPTAVTRATNLEDAAERLNKKLKSIRIDVDVDYWRGTWSDYDKKFILAFKAGKAPDIRSAESDAIPWLVDGNYILPLDGYIEESWEETYSDFFPLWEGVSWHGNRYAIPMEAIVRVLFYRRDVLKKLGLSDGDMPPVAGEGVTFDDLVRLAQDAKKGGLVEWSYIHRPNMGPYFHVVTAALGGQFVDPQTGRLVIDKATLFKNIDWHHRAAHDWEIIPKDMTLWNWKTIHKLIVEGKTLFWAGHVGHWSEWQNVAHHGELGRVSGDYLEENMGFTIWPGQTTLSNVHAYSLVSQAQHPDLAFKLITEAVSTDLVAKNAIQTSRLPVRRSVRELGRFKKERYLDRVILLLEFARAFPMHPDWDKYNSLVFDAISAAEIGALKPKQALDFLVRRARSEIPDVLIS